jgi:AcrR family transcriptional regulator
VREGALRERNRVDNRAATIDAAFALFAERGYDHVTVADICDAAGIGRRTFFRYFATKDDVLTEPAREMAAQVAAAIASALEDMPEPLVLRQALTEIASYALTHRARLRQLTAVIKNSARSSPLIRLSEQGQRLARQLADRRGGGSSGPDWRTRLLVSRAVAGLRVWLHDILGETVDRGGTCRRSSTPSRSWRPGREPPGPFGKKDHDLSTGPGRPFPPALARAEPVRSDQLRHRRV